MRKKEEGEGMGDQETCFYLAELVFSSRSLVLKT